MTELRWTYKFATDDPDKGNGFDMVLIVRGIKSGLITKGLSLAMKKYNTGSSKDAEDFYSGLDNFRCPEKLFPVIMKSFASPFKDTRKRLEKTHSIEFLKWNVTSCIFSKNKLDESELISTVIYRGDYKCI